MQSHPHSTCQLLEIVVHNSQSQELKEQKYESLNKKSRFTCCTLHLTSITYYRQMLGELKRYSGLLNSSTQDSNCNVSKEGRGGGGGRDR